jgi:bacteriocin-like protein
MHTAPVTYREQTAGTGELSDEELDQVTGGILPLWGMGLIGGALGLGVVLIDGGFSDLVDWVSSWFE